MAYVGTGTLGYTFIGTGGTSSARYVPIGTNSGLTSHGVIIGGGLGAFTATSSGASGQVLTSGGPGVNPTFQSLPASGISTLTGNSGGPISPVAGNINTVGTGSITIAGSGSSQTCQLTGLTNHALLVGAGTATITNVGPTSTAGQVLQSAGSSADPSFSTPTYPSASGTSRKILVSDGTNNVYSTETWAVPSTSGNVLTSDGTNWTSAAAPGGGILSASGTLTNAQIKALVGTPVQLIAAPGSGKIIMIISLLVKMVYGGTNAFTDTGGQGIALTYGGQESVIVPTVNFLTSSAVTATASTITISPPVYGGTIAYATAANANVSACVVSGTNITGNAAGNNTIAWQLNYYIITI